jgi:hypothetical protein
MTFTADLAAISFIFLVAGAVRGVLGMGLPTVAMGLLGLVLPVAEGAALLMLPSRVTNLWQMLRGNALVPLCRRLWPMVLGADGWRPVPPFTPPCCWACVWSSMRWRVWRVCASPPRHLAAQAGPVVHRVNAGARGHVLGQLLRDELSQDTFGRCLYWGRPLGLWVLARWW